jgi:hypothetical protein
MPPAEAATYKSSLYALKEAFADSTEPATKRFVESTCKSTADQFKVTPNEL